MNDFAFFIKKNENKDINIYLNLVNKLSKVSSLPQPHTTDVFSLNNSIFVQLSTRQKKITKNNRYILLNNSRIDNLNEIKQKYPEISCLSESEIFLELFVKYGENALKKITGPFSFLIMCMKTGSVYGGRDLFGQRPLYYSNNDEFLMVATNIDIFFEFGISKAINNEKVLQFILSNHYKDGKTFYRDINKINGGCSFSFVNNCFTLRKFIQPKDLITDNNQRKSDLIKKFRDEYINVISSITKTIEEDYATTLSGGLDSSSISLISSSTDSKKNAYSHSVHFHGLKEHDFKKTDEKKFVDIVLKNSELKHTYINLDYKNNGPLYKLNTYKMMSQPYGIINGYVHESIYDECRRKNIKYLFDGLFGDEIVSHGIYRLNELVNRGNLLIFLYELIMLRLNGVILSLRGQIKNYFIQPIKNVFKKPFSLSRFNTHELIDFSQLVSSNENYNHFINRYKLERKPTFKSDLDEQLKLFDSGLIEFSLEQLYEISAKNDVECIYPFLDNRIISRALSIPSSLKLKNGITRFYFREALKNILPKELLKRHTKSNISPFSYNQISENFESIFNDLLSETLILDKYIDVKKFKSKLNHKKLSTPEVLIIFNLIELNKWLKMQ